VYAYVLKEYEIDIVLINEGSINSNEPT